MPRSSPPFVAALLALLGGPCFAAAPPPGARAIDMDDGASIRLWEEEGVPYYAIDLDGRGFSAPRATSYALELVHGRFDPLGAAAAPAVPGALAAGGDTSVYVVQFFTQPLEAYRRAIRGLGGDVRFYLPRHGHLVRMDAAARDAVAALPFVRWVGPYHPAWRLEPFLVSAVAGAEAALPTQRYNVMLFDSERSATARAAARIRALGGTVDLEHAGKYLMTATLTMEQLVATARLDEVVHVDRWGPLEADMNVGRSISGARFVESVAGFDGEGVRGEVIDVGFNLAHVDFQARPLIQHTPFGSDSHGASTSGIIFGDGGGNPPGAPSPRGVIPAAQGIVASTAVMEGQARYDHTAELVSDPWSAVFQSASVGSPRTTEYTTISADMDATLFDFDFVICQSQSNAGDQMSRPQAWAKNIVSVGGVRHHDTAGRGDDNWGGGASIGPAADGRVKPDLCHFFDSIRTVSYPGANTYTDGFGGTSGATPIVAGHVGLLFQMWSEGIFGNAVDPDGSVFENRCHMTTAKALMINSAAPYDWTQGGDNGDVGRFQQGWGLPDLQSLYNRRDRMFVVDEADVVPNLGTAAYTVQVQAGEPALRATMVYADPPGVPGAAMHRVNDLSMKVTSPSGEVYWGNHGLLDGVWSQPGGAPNEIDTVENVFVPDPEPGAWTVEVIAFEIVQDAHAQTPEVDADFALVVSGLRPAVPADLDDDGDVDFADLLVLLSAWGPCGPPCPADLDGNGAVDFADLLILLSSW
jgi:hypothetical protein